MPWWKEDKGSLSNLDQAQHDLLRERATQVPRKWVGETDQEKANFTQKEELETDEKDVFKLGTAAKEKCIAGMISSWYLLHLIHCIGAASWRW